MNGGLPPLDTLLRRVVTAGLLAPLVGVGVLVLSTAQIAVALGAIVAAAAWEWAGLMGWRGREIRLLYVAGIAILLAGLYPFLTRAELFVLILAGGLCWWTWALYWTVRIQRGTPLRGGFGPVFRGAAGLLVVVPAWAALVGLHGDPRWGPRWVLYFLVVIWCADVGAYFVGRRWGKHRLAARISPGKTWEGALGAVGAAGIAAVALASFLGGTPQAGVVALSIAAVPVSILGDLTESIWKREAGVKDSGTLLPGHGGVLDRIDSVTAAAPFFVLGVVAMETMM